MLRDFKLKINNFGPINQANITISKINIIAGKNASGKTSISKLLYCIITAFSTDGDYLSYESMKEQFNLLINNLQIPYTETGKISELEEIRFNIESDNEFKTETLLRNYDKFESFINTLELDDEEFFKNSISKNKENIKRTQNIGNYWPLLVNLIKNEFSGNEQILENYTKSELTIYNDNKNNPFDYYIRIDEKGIRVLPGTPYENTITTNREAIYIETPYFLDYKIPFSQFNYYGQKQYHQWLLYQKLADQSSKSDILDEINNEEIIKFKQNVDELNGGEINFNNRGLLEFRQNGKIFDLNNTSSGIKSIGMLQLLLENRKLKENTYLIMDEPEVHLHPEWQVKLAKILVLLVKDLNVKLFINSHSPQFIEAMEVYSTKYGLKDETNFYLSQKDEDTEKYNVKQISHDNLYEIYNNLGDPYDIIDDVRGENIANHL